MTLLQFIMIVCNATKRQAQEKKNNLNKIKIK